MEEIEYIRHKASLTFYEKKPLCLHYLNKNRKRKVNVFPFMPYW